MNMGHAVRDETRLTRQGERTFVAGGIGLTDGGERVVLVGDEQHISPGTLRVGRHLRNALQDCALEVQLQHHAESTSEGRIHGHREVRAEDVAAFEEVFQRWEWSWLAGHRWLDVRRTGWTKGAVDIRALIKEGEKHHDAFDDGCLDLAVELPPCVRVPALNGFKTVATIGANPGDVEGWPGQPQRRYFLASSDDLSCQQKIIKNVTEQDDEVTTGSPYCSSLSGRLKSLDRSNRVVSGGFQLDGFLGGFSKLAPVFRREQRNRLKGICQLIDRLLDVVVHDLSPSIGCAVNGVCRSLLLIVYCYL
jgi:hypothetical protein